MDHLLKSSAIIILFYVCYILFMQRETFFIGNRWFLFSGLVISILVPFFVIPVYVEYTPATFHTIETTANTINAQKDPETTFDFIQFMLFVYLIGVIFFLGKLLTEFISLFMLLKKYTSLKDTYYTYIETDANIAPFSFFRWIVYNPNQFSDSELNLILTHEKVHATQWHSVDIVFTQLACVLFWFNPFIWLYKKVLEQNLEFIADQEVQRKVICQRSYQNLLLKATLPNHPLAFTNNFYNSLIKKRIVMLHKSKSNQINVWKYSLVVPILVLFVFNFNTKVMAQTKNPPQDKVEIGQNVLKFIITKDTKDKQLETIKTKLAEKKATIVFDNLERNDRDEITSIKVDYEHNGKKGNFHINSDDPINDIAISLNVNENKLSVGQTTKKLSQTFEVITEDGDTKLKKSESGENNVFVYSTDDDGEKEKIIVVGKDGEKHEVKKDRNVYVIKSESKRDSDKTNDAVFIKKNKKDTVWIKKDVKNIVWTDDEGNDVEIIVVEKGNDNIKIFTSGEEKPLILLDGKEISKKEMEDLNGDKIENINVLKGDEAIKVYGKKAKDGVIVITTKKKN